MHCPARSVEGTREHAGTQRIHCFLALLGAFLVATETLAAESLIGLTWHVEKVSIHRIDSATGGNSQVGSNGSVIKMNAAAQLPDGTILAAGNFPMMVAMDASTAEIQPLFELRLGAEANIRGMVALGDTGTLLASQKLPSNGSDLSQILRIDLSTGNSTVLREVGGVLQAIATGANGNIYGWHVGLFEPGLGLVKVDPNSGEFTDIDPNDVDWVQPPGAARSKIQALIASGPSTLLGVAEGFRYSINVGTGAAIVIDSFRRGFGDVRGLAVDRPVSALCEEIKPISSVALSDQGLVLTMPSSCLFQRIGVEYSPTMAPGSWIELGNFSSAQPLAGRTFTDPDFVRLRRASGFYRAFLRPNK